LKDDICSFLVCSALNRVSGLLSASLGRFSGFKALSGHLKAFFGFYGPFFGLCRFLFGCVHELLAGCLSQLCRALHHLGALDGICNVNLALPIQLC
jgi:hypothetical protein